MKPKKEYIRKRRKTATVTIRQDLLEQAKKQNINLSKVINDALEEILQPVTE